ncbi:ATP-sensitive inward rectifier potassium channel 12-like isoform X1 [Schistocerca cancellata]|uniref:ATP-sensitive inward rectifier potassium channel 12-like isoform X1 n=2 Tax=Schistocerca cancellata TaxID=274614 RepID=UPI002117F35A|nr:ATP-sensitive inward rectifier potassium channel 12-like isoform X1 [Schistocerca cancellata]
MEEDSAIVMRRAGDAVYTGVASRDSDAASRRLVLRSGECNITGWSAGKRRMRFLQDVFTTIVDLPWRWLLLLLSLSFFLTWLGFALLWWLIAFAHGDLEPQNLPPFQEDTGWVPCVTQIYNFTSCFMFSMENQHTTGFGARMPTEECPEAIFLMCAQGIVGVTIQTAVLGMMFAKVVRPKQRTRTIAFSRHAVVCRRDGVLCLMFRVADMRTRSHIIEAKMNILLVGERKTPEGEHLLPYHTELRHEVGNRRFFLLWPETVVHRIDARSPLYRMSAADMAASDLEVIAILEGTIESTDQRVQARTSYLLSEVLWGRCFEQVVRFSPERRCYVTDYRALGATRPVDTPTSSACDQDTNRTLPEGEIKESRHSAGDGHIITGHELKAA